MLHLLDRLKQTGGSFYLTTFLFSKAGMASGLWEKERERQRKRTQNIKQATARRRTSNDALHVFLPLGTCASPKMTRSEVVFASVATASCGPVGELLGVVVSSLTAVTASTLSAAPFGADTPGRSQRAPPRHLAFLLSLQLIVAW